MEIVLMKEAAGMAAAMGMIAPARFNQPPD